MVNQQIAHEWRLRLAAWRQRIDEGRPRPWLARAYVRVLSYLLAQYAPPGCPTEPAQQAGLDVHSNTEPPPERATMSFEMAVSELSGRLPRTRTEIRSVLETVRSRVPHVKRGPLVDGLPPDESIAVAAYYRSCLVEELMGMLTAEGIKSATRRQRRQVQILVRAGDLDRAKPIVARHALHAKDSSRGGFRSAKAFSCWGGAAGVLFGLLIAALVLGPSVDVLVVILHAGFGWVFGILGAGIGFIAGTIADG